MFTGLPTMSLPLSVSLLGAPGDDLRARVEWAASCGFQAVQFNAAAFGSRPRELGRSARRDLAALLRRLELVSSGVDLFIPPAHLTDPAHADRAASALTSAIDFAVDMAELTSGDAVLSVELPAHRDATPGTIDPGPMIRSLAEHAGSRRARIADHTWPPTWGAEGDHHTSPMGVGVDPAAIMLAGNDPSRELSKLGAKLAAVRLSDLSAEGRVTPGEGRLDLLAFAAAVVTGGAKGFVTVDLRGVKDPQRTAQAMVSRFGAKT